MAARHSNNNIEIARLAPGATLSQAQAQVDALNAAQAPAFPFAREVAAAGFRTIVVQLHADHVAAVRPTVLLLQAGALSLLLIGAVNLVNLLLIRFSSRAKELAIRQSMGASRVQIASQITTETILLTTMGGVFGLGVGAAGIRLLTGLGADQLPLGATITFNFALAALAILGSVLLGMVIALPIAFFNRGRNQASVLQAESRTGTPTSSAQRMRHIFITAGKSPLHSSCFPELVFLG